MTQKNEAFSIRQRLASFKYALAGLKEMLMGHHNSRIHVFVALCVIVAASYFRVTSIEWAILTLAIFFVLAMEAMNTALELLCDRVSTEFHPLIKKSKDVAAGAVLLSAVAAVVIGIIIFGPYLYHSF
jgi:diacylglycerol kinase (ATP)